MSATFVMLWKRALWESDNRDAGLRLDEESAREALSLDGGHHLIGSPEIQAIDHPTDPTLVEVRFTWATL